VNDTVKGLIIGMGDGDLAGMLEAHFLTGFPMTFLAAFNSNPIPAALRVHVGGPDQPNTATDIYCGGIDRTRTIIDVLKEMHVIGG
jgi:hypothetical protein